MAEYIEREVLLKHKTLIPGFIGEYVHVDRVIEAPAADVAPVVHGKWLAEDNIFDNSTWICSICHEPWVLIDGTPKDNNMNYCPNCGAKMDSEG